MGRSESKKRASGKKQRPKFDAEAFHAVSMAIQKRVLADEGARRALSETIQHAVASHVASSLRPEDRDFRIRMRMPDGTPGGGIPDPQPHGTNTNTTTAPPPVPMPVAHAYWWGFNIWFPEETMKYIDAAGTTLEILDSVMADLITIPWVGWFVAAIVGYIELEWGLMKAVDKGNGVYLSMSWFAAGIFVPTTA